MKIVPAAVEDWSSGEFIRSDAVMQDEFDAAFYRYEYPDVASVSLDTSRGSLFLHYCETGWREGRNPCPLFDTVSYLLHNPDVANIGINPFSHYLQRGKQQGRLARPSASPSKCTTLALGFPVTDWVERIRPYVDPSFYIGCVGAGAAAVLQGIDLAAHFSYRGWRSGISPNAEFDLRSWVSAHPGLAATLVNPVLANSVIEIATQARRAPPSAVPVLSQAEAVGSAFAAYYYLRVYPDVVESGMDPLIHYLSVGWRRGYRPHPQFDPNFYLTEYPDVRAADVDPFWHFLTQGKSEGRRCQASVNQVRITADSAHARTLSISMTAYAAADVESDNIRLLSCISPKFAVGVVVSVSHDRYVSSVGGTQILISDEQVRLNREGWTYLHLSPARPMLHIVQSTPDTALWVIHDGVEVGLFAAADVCSLIKRWQCVEPTRRRFVVHSALGFSPRILRSLVEALSPSIAFYWIHDYSAICRGFNLLRNDVEYCRAPSSDSMSCHVCAYGSRRKDHLASVGQLFSDVNFIGLAPSEAAKMVWQESGQHPQLPIIVHPHWSLRPGLLETQSAISTERPLSEVNNWQEAISLAFVGHPFASKGWGSFRRVVDEFANDPQYRFLHLGCGETDRLPGVLSVYTAVTPSNRFATIDHLRAARIDFVLVLSPWPETFSFVTYEAIAAGCLVLCLKASGNVAAAVEVTGRGATFNSVDELIAFLLDGRAGGLLHQLGRRLFTVEEIGTVATAPGFGLVSDSIGACGQRAAQ